MIKKVLFLILILSSILFNSNYCSKRSLTDIEVRDNICAKLIVDAVHDNNKIAISTISYLINRLDSNGETQLMKASYNADLKKVANLLILGANPNIVGKRGRTALLEVYYGAACTNSRNQLILRKYFTIAKLLLNNGANKSLADSKHRGPLFWANKFSHVDGLHKDIALLIKSTEESEVKKDDGASAKSISSATLTAAVTSSSSSSKSKKRVDSRGTKSTSIPNWRSTKYLAVSTKSGSAEGKEEAKR